MVTFTAGQEKPMDFQLTPEGIVWNLSNGLDEDPAAINTYTYPSTAVKIRLIDVEDSMPAGLLLWHEDPPGNWMYYKKGIAVNTLEYMEPGKTYIGIVPTACVWVIPQPPISSPYLAMGKAELYQNLIVGNVARDWWSLAYEDRRALAIRIAEKWSKDYFGTNALGIAKADNPPTHNGWHDRELNWGGRSPYGMEHASAYRHVLISDIAQSLVPSNWYWWKFMGTTIDSDSPEPNADGECQTPNCIWKPYDPGVRFGLPAAVAIGACDWLNCLQVAQDVTKLESWVFFQLWEVDAYPGCHSYLWPLDTYGRAIAIHRVDKIDPNTGSSDLGSTIAQIQY